MKPTPAAIEIKQFTTEAEVWDRYVENSDLTMLYHFKYFSCQFSL